MTDPANKAFIEAYRARFNETAEDGLGGRLRADQRHRRRDHRTSGSRRHREDGRRLRRRRRSPRRSATPPGARIDHQSTLGTYVGKIALKDGQGVMVDWRYVDGAAVMPPDAEVRKLRPAA